MVRKYKATCDPTLLKSIVSVLSTCNEPAATEAFCEEVILSGDPCLREAARSAGILPGDRDSRALFLFATGRISEYLDIDAGSGHSCLYVAFNRAPGPVQNAVLDAARYWHTGTILAEALLIRSRPADGVCRYSYPEWEIVVAGLIAASRHHDLFRLLQKVPVSLAVHAVRSLSQAGWSPKGQAVLKLWDDVVSAAPERWLYPDASGLKHPALEMPGSQTRSLLFSPDGRYLAAGGHNGTTGIWDVRRGTLFFRVFDNHPLSCNPAFSPDGRLLITRRCNGELAVRSIPAGELLWKVMFGSDNTGSFALSPDGSLIACTDHEMICIIRTSDGSLSGKLETSRTPSALAFSPDTQLICCGDECGSVSLRSLDNDRLQWDYPGRGSRIESISFSSDGGSIIAASGCGHPVLLDAKTGTCSCTFDCGTAGPHSCSRSTDCQYIAVSCKDDSLRVFRTSDGGCESVLRIGQRGGAACSAIVPGKRLVVAGGQKGIVRIFRFGEEKPCRMFTAHGEGVCAIAVSPDGKVFASAGFDGTTKIFSLPSGQLLRHLPVNTGSFSTLCVSGDGRTLAAPSADGLVWFWDIPGYRFTRTLDAFTGRITAAALNHDGSILACAGADGTVRLWDTTDNSLIGALTGINGSTRALVFTPDGGMLMTGGWDGQMRCWSIPSCHLVKTFSGHTGVINSIAISPDGEKTVSGGSDGTVRIWDTVSGDLLATQTGDRRSVEAVATAPGWDLVVAGGRDALIRLFRLSDGSPVAEIRGPAAPVAGLAAAFRGELVAAGADDGSIGIFSITDRIHVRNFSAHAGGVAGTACCTGGTVLASCGIDGSVRLWNLPESKSPIDRFPETLPQIACEARNNPSRQARLQWQFLHALCTLCFVYEIGLFTPPVHVGEYDIGIVG